MSQLLGRANTFCGCCSDAQKYAINSISQAMRLLGKPGDGAREQRLMCSRVALTCSKKQNPLLLRMQQLGNNFALDLAAQPVCNILCCIVAEAPHHPSTYTLHSSNLLLPPALTVILLPLATSGSYAGRKRIQRAANVADECNVPSRPDRTSCASFSKVLFTHTRTAMQVFLLEVT